MFALLLKWLVSFFTADKIGIIVRTLLGNAAQSIARDILNVENQRTAYNFVITLNMRTDLTGHEKQKIFNEQMLEWAKASGKILCESVISCLREMAVNAVKSELKSQSKA